MLLFLSRQHFLLHEPTTVAVQNRRWLPELCMHMRQCGGIYQKRYRGSHTDKSEHSPWDGAPTCGLSAIMWEHKIFTIQGHTTPLLLALLPSTSSVVSCSLCLLPKRNPEENYQAAKGDCWAKGTVVSSNQLYCELPIIFPVNRQLRHSLDCVHLGTIEMLP